MDLTHEELLTKISDLGDNCLGIMAGAKMSDALRAVVELHKPDLSRWDDGSGCTCGNSYPCLTIEAIEKELE